MFTCEIYNRDGIRIPVGVTLQPVVYSAHNLGGPERAEVAVSGTPEQLTQILRWLDYKVVIVNGLGDPVWWGRITQATVRRGRIEKGVTIEDMANRCQVLYTLTDGDGNAVDAETDWEEDAYSVSEYGNHELRHSAGDAEPTQAEALRDAIIERMKLPKPTSVAADREIGAMLRAEGTFWTLQREYYANDVGRIVFEESGNTSQPVGWGILADADLCFGDDCLQDLAGRLEGLSDEVQLRVSGSVSNNGAHTCDGSPQGDKAQDYTATTIYFDATDDIHDSEKGLNFIEPGYVIEVDGSTSNDGHHLIETQENRGHITTENAFSGTEITTESAGPSITLTRGQKIRLVDGCTNESVGSFDVKAAGQQVAYSFSHAGTAFTCAEILVRLKRVGNPADNVQVTLHSNAVSLPGTQLDAATVTGADLTTAMAWVKFSLSNTITLSPSTTYWIRVQRTGAVSPTDYYVIGLEDEEDGGGVLKLYDGTAWVDRTTEAHMPYQIWGNVETTAQIADIQDDAPGRTAGHSVRVDSGIYTRQYRDGRNLALDEIEQLIEVGTVGGTRIRAYCNIDEVLIVEEEVSAELPGLRLELDGELTRYGRALKPGELPVGEWAQDGEAPGDPTLADSTLIYIDWAEYDCERGVLSWRERGAMNMLDIDRIVQG